MSESERSERGDDNREEPVKEPVEATVIDDGSAGDPYAYSAAAASGVPSSSSVVPQPPRIWPLLPVLIASGGCFLISSVLVFVVAQLVVTGRFSADPQDMQGQLSAIHESRLGFVLIVAVPQLALLVPPVIAACLSPAGFRRRMGLVRGSWPLWAWVAAAFATPLVGLVASVLVGLFFNESEMLKETAELFRRHGQSGFLIPLALLIGGLPAICEELLFRGYIQTRLTARLGGTAGIFIASAVFAAFHLDPVHVIAVFPIGLWMGFITFRSGSLIPAMIAHFVNNVLSVLQVVLDPSEQPDMLALPTIMVMLFILGTGVLGLAGTAIATAIYPSQPTTALANSE